jgi:3'-phosphoadenosine 5'-phosphosulfate sulfotransferase (PAPS reductase)/FAD synthetase
VSAYRWPAVEEAIALLGLPITPAQFIATFRVEGRVCISFSGGRTSALLLWCVLVAWGGTLPESIVVVFANTGKEREETLRFVYECGERWGVTIHCVEFRPKPVWFERVGLNSASRNGEPLMAKFLGDGRLPNALTRTCTGETKRRTIRRYVKATFGWTVFLTLVGLRFDEGPRVLAQEAENRRTRSKKISPLAYAGVVKRTVIAFWLGRNVDPVNPRHPLPQGFDLGLRDDEGNCDMCFLKGVTKLVRLEKRQPGRCDWWIDAEDATDKRFEREWSYRDIKRWAVEWRELPLDETPDDDAECGDACYARSSPLERAAEQREFERIMAGRWAGKEAA